MNTPEPGLYESITLATYLQWDAVDQSALKVLASCPAKLKYQCEHPEDPTPAMLLGSATHDAILLPDLFNEQYDKAGQCEAITGKGTRCTNGGSVRVHGMWFCGVKGHAQGPTDAVSVLSAADYVGCVGMREAVLSHPTAGQLLSECARRELSVVWIDEETGLKCKGRFDGLSDDGDVVVDLKTTEDADKEAFSRTIYNLGYHTQAAHYLRGAVALGLSAHWFSIIAVENGPPHCLRVYEVHGEAIDAGVMELRPLLALYKQCIENDEWPGYPPEAVPISLPPYAWRQLQERAAA